MLVKTECFALILAAFLSIISGEEYDLYNFELISNNEMSKEGRRQYEEMVQKTKLPRYGTCWKGALDDLNVGCKDLTEDVQRQLAFTFTNCFLVGSGRRDIRCPIGALLTDCLGDADPVSFTAYQQFFIHTQSLCFFLRNEVWQEGALNTISKLSSVSHQVAKGLADSRNTQNKILNLQQESYGIQQDIIKQGQDLGVTLEESRLKAAEAIKEFEKSTQEQRMIIHKVFDRIVQIQTSVFGLFSGIDSIIFYAIALTTSYMVTLPSRTRNARLTIFPLWAVNMIIESRIKRPDMNNDHHVEMSMSRFEYAWWVLFWRSTTTLLASVCFIIQYLRYKDYNYLTYVRLDQVTKEMSDMKLFLQNITQSSLSSQFSNKTQESFMNHEPILNNYDSDTDSQYDSTFIGSSSESDTESEVSNESFVTSIMDETATAIEQEPNLIETFTNMNSSSSSRYNLRSRSRTPVSPNPILQRESPKMFERVVKKYNRLSVEVDKMKKQF